jgi:hypothetical protein
MIEDVQKRTKGYNIVRRVSDPHESWYFGTAQDLKIKPAYSTIYDKANRKGELIKNVQTAIGTRLFICSWCVDLIDEFNTMRWSDTAADKIVNSQSFHLMDALQYGLDILPPPSHEPLPSSPHAALRLAHEKQLLEKYQKQESALKTKPHHKVYKIKRSRSW